MVESLTMYWTPAVHSVTAVQLRSVVSVFAMDSYSVAVHTVSAVQRRLASQVGANDWNSFS